MSAFSKSDRLSHELYITGYQALLLKSLKKHVEKRTYLIKIHSHFLRCAEPTAQWIVLLVCALDVYIHTKDTSSTQTKSAMHCVVALAHLKCESVFVSDGHVKRLEKKSILSFPSYIFHGFTFGCCCFVNDMFCKQPHGKRSF